MKTNVFKSAGLRRLVASFIFLLSFGCMASCAQKKTYNINETTDNNMNAKEIKGEKVLVAFFSHTGENYAVGNIAKGNTHIVAEMIAEATGGKLFEIVPENEYPEAYDACVDVAKKEKEAGARPAVKTDIAVEDYDVVFVGYPNWWSDMPMAVYTFIEKHSWSGKTVVPFCTNEGSGLSGTERSIAAACKGAKVAKGLSMKGSVAQNERDRAKKAVGQWLDQLGL